MSTPLQLTLFGPAGYAGAVERDRVERKPAKVRDPRGQFVSSVHCDKCNGTGEYRWGGSIVNGVWQGKRGMCYQCKGKGRVTPADERRNEYYWEHADTDLDGYTHFYGN